MSRVTQAVDVAQSADFTDSLGGKIFLAVVAALLSLGATLYVNRRTAARLRRRLTWAFTVDSQTLTIPEDVREQVYVEYAGEQVDNLTTIKCTIKNEGRSGVRNHNLRFRAPEGATILAFSPTPLPEAERGYRDLTTDGTKSQERYVTLGYLGPQESITFLIVANDGEWLDWSGPRSSNPTEDIDFIRRDSEQQVDDREHLRPFFFWAIVLFFAPALLEVVPDFHLGFIPSPRTIILSLIFVLFLLPHIAPVSRLLAAILMRGRERGPAYTVAISGGHFTGSAIASGGQTVVTNRGTETDDIDSPVRGDE